MNNFVSGDVKMQLRKKASQASRNEVSLHRGLTVCAVLGVASIPITGPFGAAYAGGIMIGKFLRRYAIKNSREAYEAQRNLDRIERREKSSQLMQEGSRIIQDRIKRLDQSQLDDISRISIVERRSIFGQSKLKTKFEYD